MKKLNIAKALPIIKMAIEEDLGQGDMTSELFFKDDTTAKANIISREEIVVCGMPAVREILRCYDEKLKLKVHMDDGQAAHVGCKIATIEGPLCSMLTAGLLRRRANTSGLSRVQKRKSTIPEKHCPAGESSKNMLSAAAADIIIGWGFTTVS